MLLNAVCDWSRIVFVILSSGESGWSRKTDRH